MIAELLPRPIKLVGGPCHGMPAEAVRDVFRRDGHTYVPEGDSLDSPFRPIQSIIHALPPEQKMRERAVAIRWFKDLNNDPPGLEDIPDWRLNAWLLYLDPKASSLEVYLEKDLDSIPAFKNYESHHQRQGRRS